MSVVAAALRELMILGVTGEALVAAVERIEEAAYEERQRSLEEAVCIASQRADDELSAGAKRTRRWRERRAAEASQTVTERHEPSPNVTTVTDPLSPSFLPPTPPNQTTPIRGVSSRVRARGGDPEGFAEFWAVYPNRAARKDAVKALRRAIETEALETILAGVRRALPGWEGVETRFIPHAASWLNAERWNDPPPAPRPGPAPHDRQSPRTAKSDHLDAVARAMVAACERSEGEHPSRSPEPGAEGRGGGFASAA